MSGTSVEGDGSSKPLISIAAEIDAYPYVQSSQMTTLDGAREDHLGTSIAIDGDIAVLGAPDANSGGQQTDRGAAYVFIRQGGVWSVDQKLTASNAANNDNFGLSVAIKGGLIFVGARGADIGSNVDQGAVYVFSREGGTWREQQILTASDGTVADNFGARLSLSDTGDRVVIGAIGDDLGTGSLRGSAYVFSTSGNEWIQEAKLISPDGIEVGNFAESLAIDGDLIVVGAYHGRGVAYVFRRNSNSTWTTLQKLVPTPSEQFGSEHFGLSVDIHGTRIVVGAPDETVPNATQQGVAYVFEHNGSLWAFSAKLRPSDGSSYDWFGRGISVEQDLIVVGSPLDDTGAIDSHGSVYIYRKVGADWVESQKLLASGFTNREYLGQFLTIQGGRILVGCGSKTIGSNFAQGAGILFEENHSPPDLQAKSDSGFSDQDNVTTNRVLDFTVAPAAAGSQVELLRDGSPVASTVSAGTALTMRDLGVPTEVNLRYSSRITSPSQEVSVSTPTVVLVDETPPSVRVNQASSQIDPSRILPIAFSVELSEPETGLGTGDITLAGSTASVSNASLVLVGAGRTRTLTVGNISSNGQTLTANVGAGTFQDLAGNSNTVLPSFDNTVVIDNVAPTSVVITPADQANPAYGQPIRITAQFSEPVFDFLSTGVSLVGSTANVSSAVINISGSGTSYTISISG
ncbi:MAG: hypothetical protein AAB288_15375, partial [Acidobacteriota bacterium]